PADEAARPPLVRGVRGEPRGRPRLRGVGARVLAVLLGEGGERGGVGAGARPGEVHVGDPFRRDVDQAPPLELLREFGRGPRQLGPGLATGASQLEQALCHAPQHSPVATGWLRAHAATGWFHEARYPKSSGGTGFAAVERRSRMASLAT